MLRALKIATFWVCAIPLAILHYISWTVAGITDELGYWLDRKLLS